MNEYDRKTEPQKPYSLFRAQPWVRFWARMVDIFIIDTIVRLIQLFFFSGSMFEPILLSMGTYFIWALAEAKLISSWGTTPGKWLLKVKVRTVDSEIPDFNKSLKRSILVWILGMGLGIFTSISYIFGYYELTRRGITPWDRISECSVQYEEMSENRRIAVVLTIIALSVVCFSLAFANGILYSIEAQGF
ncbi:MAG TPA: RDD family protein [Acetivibrio sp.]|uniref:RDD family protein n=1 Tax=Acetivibrio sp. TaxID=1872092 RepID=UPI002BE876A1|nr:RDD family protein [Acetivibrio sp.]HOM01784.1 RDD family protein [Acetivibrio sp.]